MASPPTSPFADCTEKRNGEKLHKVVIDGGTTALRILLNGIHPQLPIALKNHEKTLSALKHKKILKKDQWEMLFPPDGTPPNCELFDITLLRILLTNICGFTPPSTGWDSQPPPNDRSTEANIARIIYHRNRLSHAPSTEVNTNDFNFYWGDVTAALVDLGLDQNEIDALKKEEELENLARFDFTGDINHHLDKFQDGTREWIFNEVENWLDDRGSPHRAMLITARAGMGKSVASAVICKRMQKADRPIGCHFCQHSFESYRDPKRLLQSLAYQLSSKLPEYKAALVEQLSRSHNLELESMIVQDLFVWLLKEPLSAVADPGKNVLLLIDGLDEAELHGRNELLKVIANDLSKLPLWIRFLITARPEKTISDKLGNLKTFELQQNDERNRDDIKLFFEKNLNSHETNPDSLSAIVKELVQHSDGSMLFAYFLIQMIKNSPPPVSPEELRRQFPHGISSVYQSYFERMEERLQEELKDNCGKFLTDFLRALTVSEEPLHKEFIMNILLQSCNTLECDCARRKVERVVSCISSLFILRDDYVHMFHKSVKDWLKDPSNGFFFANEKEGHKILSQLCAKELEILKGRGEQLAEPQAQAKMKYALRHGVKHMLKASENSAQMEELVGRYVTDLELVYAKLCNKDANVIKDLVLVQEYSNSRTVSEEIRNAQTLLLQFKKNPKLLRDIPQMIFQNLLNERRSALSKKASDALLTKHPEVPYMELLDKNGHQGPVEARFFCSDQVVSFDVSPDEKHLVSECRDGKTSLWALKTGEQLWEKDLQQSIKSYDEVPFGTAFRQTCQNNETGKKTLSFYRSTVFHPNRDTVTILPGNLAKVYNWQGEPTSLFPGSKCHFSACCFSGDGTKMLTDCPENARQVVMWDTENGEEIKRFESEEIIASFAISQDGYRVGICDASGSLWLQSIEDTSRKRVSQTISGEGSPCGLLHFTVEGTFVCGSIEHEQSDHRDKYKLSLPALQSRSSCVFLWPLIADDSVDDLEAVCKTSHFVSADLQIGFCLMLQSGLAVVGSPTVNYLTTLKITPSLGDVEMPRTAETAFSTDDGSLRLYTVITICNPSKVTDEQRSVKLTMRNRENAREVMQEKLFRHSSRRVENGILSVTVTYNHETGILMQTDSKTLQVWNSYLSQNLNSITMMGEVERLIPISKDLVGCVVRTPNVSSELTITLFAVFPWAVVFETTLNGRPELESIACSLQRDVVFCGENGVRKREMFLYRGEGNVPIWREDDIYQGSCYWRHPHCVFSPQGDVVVTWNTLNDGYGLHTLNARTGMRKHAFLENCYDIADCRFLNDGETMVCYRYESNVRLFSAATGEVLAVLDIGERPTCIGTSFNEPLIAVGLRFGNVKVIRAHVPKQWRDNHKKRKGSKDQK